MTDSFRPKAERKIWIDRTDHVGHWLTPLAQVDTNIKWRCSCGQYFSFGPSILNDLNYLTIAGVFAESQDGYVWGRYQVVANPSQLNDND